MIARCLWREEQGTHFYKRRNGALVPLGKGGDEAREIKSMHSLKQGVPTLAHITVAWNTRSWDQKETDVTSSGFSQRLPDVSSDPFSKFSPRVPNLKSCSLV